MEIPYGRQHIDQSDIDAVVEALQSARMLGMKDEDTLTVIYST